MYDEDMWLSLIKVLKNNHEIFSSADRAGLIDDAFSLSRYIKSGILFKLRDDMCELQSQLVEREHSSGSDNVFDQGKRLRTVGNGCGAFKIMGETTIGIVGI